MFPCSRIAALDKRLAYSDRLKVMFNTSLIAYWPLSEKSGTTIKDISGNARNGAVGGATGPTLGVAGIGDGNTAISLPGSAAYLNVYSAGLASAWGGAEGTVMGWVKVAAAGVWTDATFREYVTIRTDAGNELLGYRSNVNNRLILYYKGGGTQRTCTYHGNTTGWFHLAFTWSAANARCRGYWNGAQYLADGAAPGTWAGALAEGWNVLGAYNTNADEVWSGSMAHWLLLNKEATPDEIYNAANMGRRMNRMTVLGDSLSANVTTNSLAWNLQVRDGYKNGNVSQRSHAVTGHSIMANMDAQVSAAVSDRADTILIELGTNDENGGNMTDLQAEAEENLAELKASNPGAAIYWLNVLPRWENNTTGAEVAKGNVRATIAAACAAQDVTCWDTYTAPWIAQNQTTDGTHPTLAGHTAIAAEVLARL